MFYVFQLVKVVFILKRYNKSEFKKMNIKKYIYVERKDCIR